MNHNEVDDFRVVNINAGTAPPISRLLEIEREAMGELAFDHTVWPFLISHGLVLNLYYDDEVVGVLACIRDWKNIDTAYLATLAIAKDHQGKGGGSLLLAECLTALTEEGITNVVLSVAPQNEQALKLYYRFGFKDIALEEDRYGLGEHRLILGWTSEW